MSTAVPNPEWTTARDGSRTARARDTGAWLADCSVPRRSAEMMLRTLTVKGRVACLLLPTHAHQIAVCLEKTDVSIGVIAIVESEASIEMTRSVCDFSTNDRRLFFAWDSASLLAVFETNPGLPVPQQFIRLPVSHNSRCDETITWAQSVFSDVTAIQSARAARALSSSHVATISPLVIVSRAFRLWDDAGNRLASALDVEVIDTDDVTQCAASYIAARVSRASAIVTAEVGRADQPTLVSNDKPWITWATGARVPAYASAAPQDGLVVIDESLIPLATRAGWPRVRVRVGRDAPLPHCAGESLLLAIDLPPLTPPTEVVEYSSWRVVWDAIAKELVDHPHRLAGDIDGYLERSRRHFGVPTGDFPRDTFVTRLAMPAYAIGIARWLVREKISVRVCGQGWDGIDGVHSSGPIANRESFDQTLAGCCGLVDVFESIAHPSRHVGVPMLQTLGRTPQRILQDAWAMLRRPETGRGESQTLAAAVESLLP